MILSELYFYSYCYFLFLAYGRKNLLGKRNNKQKKTTFSYRYLVNNFTIFAVLIMSMQKIHIYLILFSLIAVSCRSEFQKILKSNDYNTKYEAAITYFNKKD